MNVYCRMIGTVLGHIKHNEIFNYVDDMIVLGEDFDKHLKNIEKTLEAFSKSGLILKVEKCHMVKQETEFIGQKITPEGIQPIKRYLYAILNIENSKTLKQLRSMLRKFNYYSKFIKNMAHIIAPLSELVKRHSEDKKDTPITLNEDAIAAINLMKKKLTEAPILPFPIFNSEDLFIVTPDASFIGLADIISQIQNGVERIICYGSRKLSEAEKKYHINKLELLSVITCLDFFVISKTIYSKNRQ